MPSLHEVIELLLCLIIVIYNLVQYQFSQVEEIIDNSPCAAENEDLPYPTQETEEPGIHPSMAFSGPLEELKGILSQKANSEQDETDKEALDNIKEKPTEEKEVLGEGRGMEESEKQREAPEQGRDIEERKEEKEVLEEGIGIEESGEQREAPEQGREIKERKEVKAVAEEGEAPEQSRKVKELKEKAVPEEGGGIYLLKQNGKESSSKGKNGEQPSLESPRGRFLPIPGDVDRPSPGTKPPEAASEETTSSAEQPAASGTTADAPNPEKKRTRKRRKRRNSGKLTTEGPGSNDAGETQSSSSGSEVEDKFKYGY